MPWCHAGRRTSGSENNDRLFGSQSLAAVPIAISAVNYLIRTRFRVRLQVPTTNTINGLQRCRPFLFWPWVTPG